MSALRPLDSACVVPVANLSDRNVFNRTQFKIWAPKQMLQRLPITLAQYNTSENLIKEFQQIIYSLYRVEEISKKALEISETSDPHRLFLNSSDEINLKRKDKYVALSNFSIYFTWRKKKKVI